jgi:hypothetical protein
MTDPPRTLLVNRRLLIACTLALLLLMLVSAGEARSALHRPAGHHQLLVVRKGHPVWLRFTVRERVSRAVLKARARGRGLVTVTARGKRGRRRGRIRHNTLTINVTGLVSRSTRLRLQARTRVRLRSVRLVVSTASRRAAPGPAIGPPGPPAPALVPASTVFSDGFESGDLTAWTQLQTGGDGQAVVQGATVRSGLLAAQLSETANPGSLVYLRKMLSPMLLNTTASGDFDVLQQGPSAVPLLTLLDPASAEVVGIYRQANGSLTLSYGGGSFATGASLPLATWGNVSLHAILAGSASTVEARLNGVLIYRSSAANLGAAGISSLQLGDGAAARPFTLVADTIVVQSTGPTAPSPPVNSAPPTVSGIAQAGKTLAASAGSWIGAQPMGHSYRWQRCNAGGGGCAAIAGATGSTYSPAGADVGGTLRVAVTANNPVGSATATSAATAVVQPPSAPPTGSSPPTITGAAQEGQLLTASPGTWNGTQPISFTYQWQRCNAAGSGCGPIGGATGSGYQLTSADVGATIRVKVIAANSVGSATATSHATAVVQSSSGGAGVVALWHMDETSGSTMFDSVGSHDGSLHSVQLGLPGSSGLAYGFNGSSSYVSVPTASDLNPSASNITITIHIDTTGTPPPPPADWDLIRKGLYTTTGGEFKMEFQQTGKASCGFEGSSNYAELTAGPTINDGQWHTIQCVKTASAIELIVDGTTFSQAADIGSIANTEDVVIGARPGSDWYSGSLDEASVQIG